MACKCSTAEQCGACNDAHHILWLTLLIRPVTDQTETRQACTMHQIQTPPGWPQTQEVRRTTAKLTKLEAIGAPQSLPRRPLG